MRCGRSARPMNADRSEMMRCAETSGAAWLQPRPVMRVWRYPGRVHRNDHERLPCSGARNDLSRSDAVQVADPELLLGEIPEHSEDGFEPLDLDTVGELRDPRPSAALEIPLVRIRVPQAGIQNIAIAVPRRSDLDAVGHFGRHFARFLQQRNVRIHPRQLAPRLAPVMHVPANHGRHGSTPLKATTRSGYPVSGGLRRTAQKRTRPKAPKRCSAARHPVLTRSPVSSTVAQRACSGPVTRTPTRMRR